MLDLDIDGFFTSAQFIGALAGFLSALFSGIATLFLGRALGQST